MGNELTNICTRCGRIMYNIDLCSETFTCDACGSILPNKHFAYDDLGNKIDSAAVDIKKEIDEVNARISEVPMQTAKLIAKKNGKLKTIIERIIVSIIVSLIILAGQYIIRKTGLFSGFIDWVKSLF